LADAAAFQEVIESMELLASGHAAPPCQGRVTSGQRVCREKKMSDLDQPASAER